MANVTFEALEDAIRNNDTKQIKELLTKGYNVNARNEAGDTLLHVILKETKNLAASFVQAFIGENIFAKAAKYEKEFLANVPEFVKILVDHGADINAKNSLGDTPLKLAIHNGLTEVVNFLKTKGATE